MGLVDLLAAARLCDCCPEELVLWGVQPEVMGVGLELSPSIAAQVETLVENVLTELSRWGIEPTRSVKQEEST
jgi:hydrogenase maturation protease